MNFLKIKTWPQSLNLHKSPSAVGHRIFSHCCLLLSIWNQVESQVNVLHMIIASIITIGNDSIVTFSWRILRLGWFSCTWCLKERLPVPIEQTCRITTRIYDHLITEDGEDEDDDKIAHCNQLVTLNKMIADHLEKIWESSLQLILIIRAAIPHLKIVLKLFYSTSNSVSLQELAFYSALLSFNETSGDFSAHMPDHQDHITAYRTCINQHSSHAASPQSQRSLQTRTSPSRSHRSPPCPCSSLNRQAWRHWQWRWERQG